MREIVTTTLGEMMVAYQNKFADDKNASNIAPARRCRQTNRELITAPDCISGCYFQRIMAEQKAGVDSPYPAAVKEAAENNTLKNARDPEHTITTDIRRRWLSLAHRA